MMWTYLYVRTVAFAMVFAMILLMPYAATMQPGDGIPGRYFIYAVIIVIAGWAAGLIYL